MPKGGPNARLSLHARSSQQSFSLFTNDLPAADYFLFALLQVIIRNGLQVIDVIQKHALHEVHGWIYVARNGDVDQQQWTVPPQLHQRLELRAVKNMMWSGGAADNNINPGKLLCPIFKVNGAAAQLRRERERPVVRTIRDNDASRAAGEQSSGGFFTGIPRPDDQHFTLAQCGKYFLRQFNRDRTDRNAPALNIRFGANLFSHVESLLKCFVQVASSVAVLQRGVVSRL